MIFEPPYSANSISIPYHPPDQIPRRQDGRRNKLNMSALTIAASAPASLAVRAAHSNKCISLAQSLPSKLLRFLARHPPNHILAPAGDEAATPPAQYFKRTDNHPFFARKLGETWIPAKYSNRRQAELVKAARKYGLESLMPYSKKDPETRLARKVARGWRGKGTGVGQQVKGHKHERMLAAKYVILLGDWTCAVERAACGKIEQC